MHINSNVEALCGGWLEAKRREAEAIKARHQIEEQLTQALEVKSEGSLTHKLDHYKVTFTQPIYRKLDVTKWDGVKTSIGQEFWPVKIITEADPSGCKWLARERPDLWAMIAPAFIVKPGKVSVEITQRETEA